MLAGFAGRDRHGAMQVMRHQKLDGVDLRIGQDVLVTVVYAGDLVLFRERRRLGAIFIAYSI